MKKLLAILFLFSLFSCSTPPKPEGLILKVQYQPEKVYSITTIRGAETVITYSGQDIAMRKLKSMGVKNPTISKVRTKTDAELVTGKSSADSSFQVNLTYKKIMSLDGKNEIPEGTVVQGEIQNNALPTFNKVVSNTLKIDQRIQLLQTVQNTFEQFKFPEQRLKIGDQFSTDRPTSMPMEGSTIAIAVTTTYKLLSITNNLAEFELSQSYQMTPKIMDNSFTGTGSGKGRLTYDRTNCLITDYSIKTELDMNKKLDYYEFDLKTVNEFSQQTKLLAK
ncbi:MAG: hypothetical protein JZU47_14285 [Prolixibacteraceae bacterium]|nr:hypothetical protein [Prolixibacteraceae bacterium]